MTAAHIRTRFLRCGNLCAQRTCPVACVPFRSSLLRGYRFAFEPHLMPLRTFVTLVLVAALRCLDYHRGFFVVAFTLPLPLV